MHWWLTGFRWRVFSEPEELKMIFSVCFPNHEMQQAFIYGEANTPDTKDFSMKYGLTGLGYNYKELDGTSVQICFSKPHSIQPVISSNIKKLTQATNYGMVKEYNKIFDKYHIPNNDPDIISRILLEKAGIAEKMLYEKIVHYYNRKIKTPACNINLI